jgi:hypothetical protein
MLFAAPRLRPKSSLFYNELSHISGLPGDAVSGYNALYFERVFAHLPIGDEQAILFAHII